MCDCWGFQARLTHAKEALGCETINIAEYDVIRDAITEIVGIPEVDAAIDAIGYEVHGHGHHADQESPTDALDTLIGVTRYGAQLGIPGVYLSMDPKGKGINTKLGRPAFEFGRAWDKGLTLSTGQVPVMRYNRQLMTSILFDRVKLNRVLNTTIISLDDASAAYREFEQGVPKKFTIDPHGLLTKSGQYQQSALALSV